MAITISGVNNNDRIVASDGTIDALSGFNVVGVITAASFTGDLVGNVTGNVTGNINNTTLLLQTGGSERFRITGNNELGIAGANYGSAGQVLTSGGSGSAVSWTTIEQGVTSDASNNTVGGSNAGDSIISGGTENTVFGYNAGTAISTGDNNTFFGSRAGRSMSTGLQNTGVGYNVMGNTSGTGNAALGMDAGNGILGGSYNVALGWNALSNTNNNGTNNIVIGKLADISANNVSNEVTIGNSDINHFRIPGIGVSFSEGGAVISGIVTATSFAGTLQTAAQPNITSVGTLSALAVSGNINVTSSDPTIVFTDSDNNPDFDIKAGGGRFAIRDSTNNAERLRINSGGEVLIGTTTGTGNNLTIQDAGTSTTAGGNIVARFQSNGSGRDASIQLSDNVAHSALISMVSSNFAINLSGNERLRITSDGKLGVGVASPVSILHLHESGSSGAPIIQFSNGDTGTTTGDGFAIGLADNESPFIYNRENTALRIGTNNIERMRINSDGSVYFSENIASQSPTGQFGFRMDRGGGNGTIMNIENLSNDSVNNNAGLKLVTNHSNVRIIHHNQGGFYVINSGNGYLHYYSNGSSRVFIDTNGNVCVGTQSASVSTQAKGISLNQDGAMISRRDGVMHYYKSISTGGYYALQFYSANTSVGNIFFNSGGTQFNTSSDYRRKENIVSLTNGISKLKQLKTYNFNFKDNPSETLQGFLAHEAQEVIPHAVTGTKDQVATAKEVEAGVAQNIGDPIYQTIDHSKLVPLLTAALQEETAKREALEARVSALEGS